MNVGDLLRRGLLVGQHDRRRLAGDLLEQGGVRTRGVLVGGDDEAAGIGHVPTYLGQPGVRRSQHRRDPGAGRVEGGTQGLGVEVLGQRLAEPGGHLVAGAGAPLHLAGVRQEQHRPHDVVGERVLVAVGEVGERARDAVCAGGVGDERDRVDVRAERRAGQGQPTGRGLERLADAFAPRQRVTRMVHLVEDDQRLVVVGPDPHGQRVDRDAGVGDRDADVVLGRLALARGVRRVDRDAGPRTRLGPLELQVLGRGHDDDAVDDAAAEQLGRDGQREGRLAGAGRRHGEVVPRASGPCSRPWRPTARRGGTGPSPTLLARARQVRARVTRSCPRRCRP